MNICDYLNWRGDLSLTAAPFNEVDNLILSQIVYPDYEGIVGSENTPVSIADVVARYEAKYGDKGNYMGAIVPPASWNLLRQMAQTVRFGNIRFSGYINRVIHENSEQFAAIVITLADDFHYVSFRGTDDNLSAWKENLLMAVEDALPARKDALNYLEWAADAYEGNFIVGGHSKGGNLAVWASVGASEAIQDRILRVYSNDGPGFDKSFFAEEGFLRMADRIHVIMPQYSIVGTFFHQYRKEIIKSNVKGLWAHDGFNWEVLGDRFVREPELSGSSKAFDNAFDDSLEKMDKETRTVFIDDIFKALSANGEFLTLSDMKNIKPKQIFEMITSLGSKPELKQLIHDIVTQMIREMAEDGTEKEQKTGLK